eukprot:superscaffoldBa00000721_g6780
MLLVTAASCFPGSTGSPACLPVTGLHFSWRTPDLYSSHQTLARHQPLVLHSSHLVDRQSDSALCPGHWSISRVVQAYVAGLQSSPTYFARLQSGSTYIASLQVILQSSSAHLVILLPVLQSCYARLVILLSVRQSCSTHLIILLPILKSISACLVVLLSVLQTCSTHAPGHPLEQLCLSVLPPVILKNDTGHLSCLPVTLPSDSACLSCLPVFQSWFPVPASWIPPLLLPESSVLFSFACLYS